MDVSFFDRLATLAETHEKLLNGLSQWMNFGTEFGTLARTVLKALCDLTPEWKRFISELLHEVIRLTVEAARTVLSKLGEWCRKAFHATGPFLEYVPVVGFGIALVYAVLGRYDDAIAAVLHCIQSTATLVIPPIVASSLFWAGPLAAICGAAASGSAAGFLTSMLEAKAGKWLITNEEVLKRIANDNMKTHLISAAFGGVSGAIGGAMMVSKLSALVGPTDKFCEAVKACVHAEVPGAEDVTITVCREGKKVLINAVSQCDATRSEAIRKAIVGFLAKTANLPGTAVNSLVSSAPLLSWSEALGSLWKIPPMEKFVTLMKWASFMIASRSTEQKCKMLAMKIENLVTEVKQLGATDARVETLRIYKQEWDAMKASMDDQIAEAEKIMEEARKHASGDEKDAT